MTEGAGGDVRAQSSLLCEDSSVSQTACNMACSRHHTGRIRCTDRNQAWRRQGCTTGGRGVYWRQPQANHCPTPCRRRACLDAVSQV